MPGAAAPGTGRRRAGRGPPAPRHRGPAGPAGPPQAPRPDRGPSAARLAAADFPAGPVTRLPPRQAPGPARPAAAAGPAAAARTQPVAGLAFNPVPVLPARQLQKLRDVAVALAALGPLAEAEKARGGTPRQPKRG